MSDQMPYEYKPIWPEDDDSEGDYEPPAWHTKAIFLGILLVTLCLTALPILAIVARK